MNEEKLRCTPGSIPPLTAVQRSGSGMVKAAAEAGYEAAPRSSIVKAICGSSSKPSLA